MKQDLFALNHFQHIIRNSCRLPVTEKSNTIIFKQLTDDNYFLIFPNKFSTSTNFMNIANLYFTDSRYDNIMPALMGTGTTIHLVH